MREKKVTFIFDLDGTLTCQETLPMIAAHFGLGAEMADLTARTIAGEIPFEQSFRTRVAMLSHLAHQEIAQVVARAEIWPELAAFITEHRADCMIASGNLRPWVAPLVAPLGCRLMTSVQSGNIQILRKEDLVAAQKRSGCFVVFVGDSFNDAAAMAMADLAIACAMVHPPALAALRAAHYIAHDAGVLGAFLRRVKSTPELFLGLPRLAQDLRPAIR